MEIAKKRQPEKHDPPTTPSPGSDGPFEVGKAYFIRTVTYHLTGRVAKIAGGFMLLDAAAWIGDSGRFSQAILKGTLNEVEPVGRAIVSLAAITDAFPWEHELPNTQK